MPQAFVWFAERPESSEETRASLSPRFPPCATEPSNESYVALSEGATFSSDGSVAHGGNRGDSDARVSSLHSGRAANHTNACGVALWNSLPQAAPGAVAGAATSPVPNEGPDLTDGCLQPCGPASAPLPQESDIEVEIMDTSSCRKRPRPTENTSDDEWSSRKVAAVTPVPESGTPHQSSPPWCSTMPTTASRRCSQSCRSAVSVLQLQVAPPLAACLCMAAEMKHWLFCTTFPRNSRLFLAQELSVLPGVQEVRVNTQKQCRGIRRDHTGQETAANARKSRQPADRAQSSGIVQGILGDHTEEELLAGVRAMCRYSPLSARGRHSFCVLHRRPRLPSSASFKSSMLSGFVGRAPGSV
ncbi:hypothetical protein HPB50_018758 [Hyalomma asiaticum]|uniref:Uncharacterized protein n=1 Tax=Hyalomma asiaticum TaxID=266040 RepID=A0ACB7S3P0_HYAAI|nr:hypothetical protein HPB50_018758 [Hyalomma asiaticum]